MYTKETHKTFRQSDKTDKWNDGWTDMWTDKQRDIKTKHKQGRHTYYIYCHADIQIYYNERALTALKGTLPWHRLLTLIRYSLYTVKSHI